jgi:BirA family biotin operon repressor/biotin-[acetyl-CoA-carboxylase] ligase
LALLPLTAAVAVCDIAGPRAQIKWPNDVVIPRPPEPRAFPPAQKSGSERRGAAAPTLAKLAGILTEARLQEGWAVLGIGLNVAVRLKDLPDDLRLTAATMGESPEMIEPTLERLLDALERRLREAKGAMLDAWQTRDALRGHEIAWGSYGPGESPAGAFSAGLYGRGQAQGIDDAGRLLVALADGGLASLDAGEVRLVRVEDG